MSSQERIETANQIYERELREKLERGHKGEIVAIEITSGDFFLGKNEVEAYEQGIKKYPGKTFVYKRVGYKTTHFVGSFPSAQQPAQEWLHIISSQTGGHTNALAPGFVGPRAFLSPHRPRVGGFVTES